VPRAARVAVGVAATAVRRLANREDDVLDQLREQQDVGHVSVQRLVEQPGRAAGCNQQDRRTRVLADRVDLVCRERRAPGRVQDRLEMTPGECAGAARDVGARADHLDLGMACEGLAQLVEPFAGSGRVQPHALALCGVGSGHQ